MDAILFWHTRLSRIAQHSNGVPHLLLITEQSGTSTLRGAEENEHLVATRHQPIRGQSQKTTISEPLEAH